MASSPDWSAEIAQAQKEMRDFHQKGRKVLKQFRDSTRGESDFQFNILWSNTEIQKSAVFSSAPKPNVKRRFYGEDKAARAGAEALQKAISYALDDNGAYDELTAARDDALLPGWGIVRVQYDAEIEEHPLTEVSLDEYGDSTVLVDDQGNEINDPDGELENGTPYIDRKVPNSDQVWLEYVPWDQMLVSPADRWSNVYWIAFVHEMRQSEIREQFGEDVANDRSLVPLGVDKRDGSEAERRVPASTHRRARIFEIWDKDSRKRIWLADGGERPIEVEDDPLGLQAFFPTPRPVSFLGMNDDVLPLAEFLMYQDQARELNIVNRRIVNLSKGLKVAGLYDAATEKIPDLAAADDLEFIPIESAGELRSKGGLENSIFYLPIIEISRVVSGLIEHRDSLKAQIYELTGISDILRGASDPRETASAQRIKGQYGNLRIDRKATPMARFARDSVALMGEVIAEHFEPSTIEAITGEQVSEDVARMLSSQRLRQFRIDIETDSTVAPDRDEEKRQAAEFITAVTQYLQSAESLISASPHIIPLVMDMLKYMVRRFDVSSELEEQIDQTAQKLIQAAQNPPKPRPDPDKVLEAKTKLKGQMMQERASLREKMLETQSNESQTQLQAQVDLIDTIIKEAE